MRFIVDAQLPPTLARYLIERGHEAEHVVDLGLEAAADLEIWNFAIAHSAIIVTKDGDFIAMRALVDQGPSIVWIRLGNTTTPFLLDAIGGAWRGICDALESGETVIEVS